MPETNLVELTVSELAFALKRTVETAYGLIRVRGELSGFMRATSGHRYFCLKDDRAVLDAVAWRNTLPRLGFTPEDGLEVVCTGRLTTYPGRSKYQLTVETMEPAGVGALMALLEERRRRLEAEGLFSAIRKRPLPLLPTVIGIITSPIGAVIRDILHRLEERCPRRVLVWPVAVQGEAAAAQVAAAIAGFNALPQDGPIPRPDLLIVARGGGSIEDLWPFNEEIVVRAAAASAIPLVSAVGHETDTTLIDHAADRRAPTPSAAAELAVPVRADFLGHLGTLGERQRLSLDRSLREHRAALEALRRGLGEPARLLRLGSQRVDDLAQRLRLRSPAEVVRSQCDLLGLRVRRLSELLAGHLAKLDRSSHDLDARLRPELLASAIASRQRALPREASRLHVALARRLGDTTGALERASGLLMSLGPSRVLERGYAIVRLPCRGPVLARRAEAMQHSAVTISFADGDLAVTVAVAPAGSPDTPTPRPTVPARRRKAAIEPTGQPRLL